ncbi:MAG: hypothetical protein NTX50_32460, partial [Candidatus Sumerlaeota bacterium]|nr:hypothetical protein [Candidatus Sumerlaeota bacterium]
MSYADGWAAINLEMPARIPRTEYSAESHWDLIKAVTGIEVSPASDSQAKSKAGKAFMRAWNYDLRWSTLIGGQVFGDLHTDMGHAVYAAGGVDRRDAVRCPFHSPDEVIEFDPWKAYGEVDRPNAVRDFEAHYK